MQALLCSLKGEKVSCRSSACFGGVRLTKQEKEADLISPDKPFEQLQNAQIGGFFVHWLAKVLAQLV